MLNMSPLVFEAPPPSPACIVIPGTFRNASVSVVAPCSSSSAVGMTWMVCGVSTGGAEYFTDSSRASPVTCTASAATRISIAIVDGSMKRCDRLVPSSSRSSACCAVSVPLTPAEVMLAITSAAARTVRPVTASNC